MKNFLGSYYFKLWFVLWNKDIFFAETLLKGKWNFTLIYWKCVRAWCFISCPCINMFTQRYFEGNLSGVFLCVYCNSVSQSGARLALVIVVIALADEDVNQVLRSTCETGFNCEGISLLRCELQAFSHVWPCSSNGTSVFFNGRYRLCWLKSCIR